MSEWFDTYGFAEVAEGLLIGAYPQDAQDVAALAGDGVTCVFNLVSESEYPPGGRSAVESALREHGIEERRLELVDFGGLLPGQLEHAVQGVLTWLEDGRRVYLHCRAGMQRSAAVAAGVLALRDEVDIAGALERLAARKPDAEPLPHQLSDLTRWWRLRNG